MNNDPSVHVPGPSSLAMALLFGSIAFATASLAAKSWLVGDTRSFKAGRSTRSEPLDTSSFASLYTLLYQLTVFGLILLFAFICEFHPPFPHSEKSYDRDEFFMLTVLLLIASAYTVTKNDQNTGKQRRLLKSSQESAAASITDGLSSKQENETKSWASVDELKDSSSFMGEKSTNTEENIDTLEDINLTEDDLRSLLSRGSESLFSTSQGATSTVISRKTQIKYPLPVEAVKPCNDVLNRDQTEEWKGWMQFVFLLYHYYNAEELYNLIRVMITCYVWMTGFGNFSFFYVKNDFSFVRVVQMLWRLNFLVIFLCLSQGTTYILYYICPLHTYYFFLVYATMRIGSHLNYTRFGLRLKMFVVACIIFLIWDIDSGLFRLFHFPFAGQMPKLGATSGTLWEWYFRTFLDHWSTFLGMVFASNYPIVSLFYRKLEAQQWSLHWAAKGVVGASLLFALYLWISGPLHLAKFDYNRTNPFFGVVPLITYVYFRNLTPTLRSYSLDLLHQIGKTTLETYLMQHHIWLTSDAKSLLTLVPGWPKVNMITVTCIYFIISRRIYKLTLFLRGMLLPNDKAKCIQNLTYMGFIVLGFFALAHSLTIMNAVSTVSIVIMCVIGGALIYQTVLDLSWQAFRECAPTPPDAGQAESKKIAAPEKESIVAKMSPPLIGTMVILILCLLWQVTTMNGAGKILPLPSNCEADVNNGMWVPINGCNEFSRGLGYRDHHVSGMATCTGAFVWGWYATASNSMCRFSNRSAKKLQSQLKQRRIVFVGDSMTRSIFYAFSRAMGDDIGATYDATLPKHSDVSREIGTTQLEFRWAPMAQDSLGKLQQYNKDVFSEADIPDALIIGGGAWDRLHSWAIDDKNLKGLKDKLKALASEMGRAKQHGIPTVWVNPTTINTKALLTDEKRENLKEQDMQQMRELTAEMGVWLASTFVLDGTAFSKDRVNESYDGVHYPPQVYDAGAQILANAMDWVISDRPIEDDLILPRPGSMASPLLGLIMLGLLSVGLFLFDGFFGVSYMASLFVKGVKPNQLYEESFTELHKTVKLPPIRGRTRGLSADKEIFGLLGNNAGLEMASNEQYSR